MNTRVRVREVGNIHDDPQETGFEKKSLLYFHCADPLELGVIAREGCIPENGTMQSVDSLRLYPGARDCVDLYDFASLRKHFHSGVGVVLSVSCLDGQLFRPHIKSAKDSLSGVVMHKGAIDLRGGNVGKAGFISFYSLSGGMNHELCDDLELHHPWLYGQDLEIYATLRKEIAERKFGLVLPRLEKLPFVQPVDCLARYQSACVESITKHFDCVDVNSLLSVLYQMLYSE